MASGTYFDEFDQNPYGQTEPTVGSTNRSPAEFTQAAQRSSNGYTAPNYTAPTVYTAPRYQGGGVDTTKWTNPAHNTSKYEVLRYLDQFNPQTLGRPGLTALSDEAKSYLSGLGYQIRDEDKIFRQDIGEIDVLHGDRSEYGWRLTGNGNVVPTKAGARSGARSAGGSAIGGGGGTGRAGGSGSTGRTGQPAIIPRSAQFTDPSTATFQDLILRRLEELQESVQRPDNDLYRRDAQQRADDLKRAPYTSAEEQALITRMRDPLTQARDARREIAKERMGARNLMPSSGLYQDQVFNDIDRDYERNLAAGTNDLAVRAIDEGQRRRTASLDTLAQLVALGNDERSEDEGRERELLTTGAILPELTERRLQLLIDANSGTTSSMGSLTNDLMSLWNTNTRQSEFQAGQRQDNAAQWGEILGLILNSPLLSGGGR